MTRKHEDRLRRDIDGELDTETGGSVLSVPGATSPVPEAEIEEFLKIYPEKAGYDDKWTRREFGEALRAGVSAEELIRAAKNYRAECDRMKTEARFIKTASYWIRDGAWRDWLGGAPNPVLKTEKYLSVCREFRDRLTEKYLLLGKLYFGEIDEDYWRAETRKLDMILADVAARKRAIIEQRSPVEGEGIRVDPPEEVRVEMRRMAAELKGKEVGV